MKIKLIEIAVKMNAAGYSISEILSKLKIDPSKSHGNSKYNNETKKVMQEKCFSVFKEKKTLKEIAKELNIALSMVHVLLRDYEPYRNYKSLKKRELANTAMNYKLQHLTLKEIGEIMGKNQNTIHHLLKGLPQYENYRKNYKKNRLNLLQNYQNYDKNIYY